MVPTLHVTDIGPHSLDAVMLGSQAGRGTGLHPKLITPFEQEPLNEGGVTCVQLKVRVQVLVIPHAVAVKVNTCERLHPLTMIVPAEQDTGTEPQLLDAVTAPPNPPLDIPVQEGKLAGLQPRLTVLLQFVNVGVGVEVAETVKVA